ncbi:MAG TPA: HD-GYP domain-containing protein, partial [Vicinamibacterales bacterium]|nr:HD-GYP domain-containing protein [Vicinamibacterales bacterium]
RKQVRESVAANLSASQRVFSALETRRQREMIAQTVIVADSPTLKAAIDTYQQETRGGQPPTPVLFETIDNEMTKLADQIGSADAIVLTDLRQNTMSSAGRYKDRFPRGKSIQLGAASGSATVNGIARMSGVVFRVSAVPMEASDGATLGTLYLATSLDDQYATKLKQDSGAADVAIVSDGLTIASTLPARAAHEFETMVGRSKDPDGVATLDGEQQAYRRLVAVDDNTTFYALGSIDAMSRSAMRDAEWSLAAVAAAALALALGASLWLARLLADPIGRLSTSLAAMAASHDVKSGPGAPAPRWTQLPMTGSSREVDALTATFNNLMASVASAEAKTEAAYTGAIRALATALDARDAYTAGHSERVSVLSVAIGRHLKLATDDLEVIRLGALLHDIGKIGVPDNVLMKPGKLTDTEFQTIKQHPVLGARILRSVPFLSRHLAIVELHHERPDGRGYPHGLRGDDIPLAARIVHVADAYDAMTTARAYRGARPSAEALQELWRCAGTEFHAEIVGALAGALPGVVSETGDVVVAAHV